MYNTVREILLCVYYYLLLTIFKSIFYKLYITNNTFKSKKCCCTIVCNLAMVGMLTLSLPSTTCLVMVCLYESHHDSRQQANPLPTVGVRDHVAVADGQEGDGDQPHGTKESTGHLLCIVIPVET